MKHSAIYDTITTEEWAAEAERLEAIPNRTIAQEDAMRWARMEAYRTGPGAANWAAAKQLAREDSWGW
jgi:hypothetical protein